MLIACLLIGGAIGAPARYLLDGFVQDRAHGVFPWGTFVINATGSLILGLITGLAMYHGLGDLPKIAIGTGFCGAYTTFSTFSYETVRLLEEGSVGLAAGNVFGSVAAGLAAAALGLALTAAF
ncbi:MAG: fluoride efflux transporter CrcB [Acidimicrobiia bacterium]